MVETGYSMQETCREEVELGMVLGPLTKQQAAAAYRHKIRAIYRYTRGMIVLCPWCRRF